MLILVINAGSSSLKYQLINADTNEVPAKGLCERIGLDGLLTHTYEGGKLDGVSVDMPNHAAAIKVVLDALTSPDHGAISDLTEIAAVGHRVVHGGEVFSGSVLITQAVMDALNECAELAPLHNPPNIVGIEACQEVMASVPQVAVFDTSFHQTMPGEAYMYGLPYEYYDKYRIRRYGFHGTSHRYVTQRALDMLGNPDARIVTCHLGNGSSIAAVNAGKSVDTTMGFTPLEGLIMGTRCGSIDPAIVTYVMDKEGLDSKGMSDLMNKKSGLAGISGSSSDVRDLTEASKNGDERAKLALDMFSYQIKKYIASYAAAMGGVEAVVFTAGIGENSTMIRANSLSGLEFMGITLDDAKNTASDRGDRDIAADGSKVKILVIPTNEELMIALDTKAIVGGK